MENSYVLNLSDSKFKDLFLCFCGYAQCQPFHSFGPAVRPNYILHYILKGRGIYQVGEKKYELTAGQGFLIEPEVLTFYQADGREPWVYCWLGFSGTRAKEYLGDIGLNGQQLVFQSEYGKELKQIILKMMKINPRVVSEQYRLQGYLYEFFSILMQDAVVQEDKESKESVYIKHAISYIRNHYSQQMKVMDIAQDLGVTRSYLYKLFEKSLNLSPQEFLNRFRMSRGRELLSVTELSIEEIAASCGYTDFRVFSKAFKKENGMAPSEYRVRHKDEMRRRLEEGQENLEQIMREEGLEKLKREK